LAPGYRRHCAKSVRLALSSGQPGARIADSGPDADYGAWCVQPDYHTCPRGTFLAHRLAGGCPRCNTDSQFSQTGLPDNKHARWCSRVASSAGRLKRGRYVGHSQKWAGKVLVEPEIVKNAVLIIRIINKGNDREN